jgi:predicted nucleic acid-binding protein
MAYKKIFVDSDILLDLLLHREPFAIFSRSLLNKASEKTILLHTSTLILANVHYLLVKHLNKKTAREYVRFLSEFLEMLPFEPDNILLALNHEHGDFEDTIQYRIAKKHQCDLVVSRNIKHYKKFDIPVLTAEQLLRTIKI